MPEHSPEHGVKEDDPRDVGDHDDYDKPHKHTEDDIGYDDGGCAAESFDG